MENQMIYLQRLETLLDQLDLFIQTHQQMKLEDVPLNELDPIYEQIEECLFRLKAYPASTDEQFLDKKRTVGEKFKSTIRSFETWRDQALSQGKTLNQRTRAAKSYNKMIPF